jgi:hypothetical protein
VVMPVIFIFLFPPPEIAAQISQTYKTIMTQEPANTLR